MSLAKWSDQHPIIIGIVIAATAWLIPSPFSADGRRVYASFPKGFTVLRRTFRISKLRVLNSYAEDGSRLLADLAMNAALVAAISSVFVMFQLSRNFQPISAMSIIHKIHGDSSIEVALLTSAFATVFAVSSVVLALCIRYRSPAIRAEKLRKELEPFSEEEQELLNTGI